MSADATKFSTYVLWISGYSPQAIACWVGVSQDRIRGIIGRSPWRDRDRLSLSERQRLLQDFHVVRTGDDGSALDGGLLDKHDWATRDHAQSEPARTPVIIERTVSAC